MLSLKSEIGKKSGPYRDVITAERIGAFLKAIGASESSKAPPTFMTVFRRGEFDLLKSIGVDLAQILHTEQEYEYFHEICAGDQIRFESVLAHVLEKQSSSVDLQFLTFATDVVLEKASGEVLAGQSQTTVVIRNQKTQKADVSS
jgi:acyl-CoA thioesterase FadM